MYTCVNKDTCYQGIRLTVNVLILGYVSCSDSYSKHEVRIIKSILKHATRSSHSRRFVENPSTCEINHPKFHTPDNTINRFISFFPGYHKNELQSALKRTKDPYTDVPLR